MQRKVGKKYSTKYTLQLGEGSRYIALGRHRWYPPPPLNGTRVHLSDWPTREDRASSTMDHIIPTSLLTFQLFGSFWDSAWNTSGNVLVCSICGTDSCGNRWEEKTCMQKNMYIPYSTSSLLLAHCTMVILPRVVCTRSVHPTTTKSSSILTLAKLVSVRINFKVFCLVIFWKCVFISAIDWKICALRLCRDSHERPPFLGREDVAVSTESEIEVKETKGGICCLLRIWCICWFIHRLRILGNTYCLCRSLYLQLLLILFGFECIHFVQYIHVFSFELSATLKREVIIKLGNLEMCKYLWFRGNSLRCSTEREAWPVIFLWSRFLWCDHNWWKQKHHLESVGLIKGEQQHEAVCCVHVLGWIMYY